MNLDGNFPSYETQQEIKTTVNGIKTTTESTKTGVDNLNTKQDSILLKIQNGALKQNIAVFDKPGTYTWKCPDGVTTVVLTMFGGGGSGAVRTVTEYAIFGGGGGGGAYVDKKPIKVIPGTTYSLIVGAGGAGVSSSDGNGSYIYGRTGGATSAFGITCNGGVGGYGTGNVFTTRARGNSPLCNKGASSSAGFSVSGEFATTDVILAGTRFGLPGTVGDREYGGGAGFGDGGDANGSTHVANGAGSGGANGIPSVNRASLKGGDGIIIIEY